MKRFIVVGLLILTSITAFSQKKLFEEALSKGREKTEYYVAVNEKGKVITVKELEEYAKNNGYLVGKYTTKTVSRFGDVATSVKSFEFLPKEEYLPYCYYKSREHTNEEFSSLTQKGKVYYLDNDKKFHIIEVMWSGRVVDGMLDGNGVGFAKPSFSSSVFFVGNFQKGLPKGKCSYKIIKDKWNNITYMTAEVGEISEGLASLRVQNDTLAGFVNERGDIVIPAKFRYVNQKFTNGRATVQDSKKGEYYIDRVGNFLEFTSKQKQLNIQAEAERKRKEEADRQAEYERQLAQQKRAREEAKAREEARLRRIERFRNAQEGDVVYYSQDWTYTDRFFGHIISVDDYTMRVTCFIERVVNNGERLQVRVGDVSSSSKKHYSEVEIDGIKYHKGDVLWIKPFENEGWQIR